MVEKALELDPEDRFQTADEFRKALLDASESPVSADRLTVEPGATLEVKYALQVYPSLEAGLLWKPEVVFICTPTSLHLSTALQAARARSW